MVEYEKCGALREGNVTTSGSSNRELATNGDSVDGITLLKRQLATVTAERDELASDIVRLKMHLEAAERAARANGEEARAANERAEKAEERSRALSVANDELQERAEKAEHVAILLDEKAMSYINKAAACESWKERAKAMRAALEIYANEKEWSARGDYPWKLLFNSRHMDGDGYETAKQALQEVDNGTP